MSRRSARIRVLFVTDSPTVSGAEHVLFDYLDKLPGKHFGTHVYFSSSNQRMRDELDRRGAKYTATDAFSKEVVRTTLRPDLLVHFARAFWRVRGELQSLHRREGFDLVHSISYPAAIYGSLAASAVGVPHIWHEHGIKKIHTFNRFIYRMVAAHCRHVIGPSNAVTGALALSGMEPAKLRTVYNGINLDRFSRDSDGAGRVRSELGLDERFKLVALIGQLLPHKGHQVLIDAAPLILERHPHTRFLIVGSLENPPYEAQLRRSLDERGLSQAFMFTGWRRDVHALISAIDVSVVATITPEPAALSLMEAMALGCPLVASRTGGTEELVIDGKTGLLFPPGDTAQLAAQVSRLLSDSDLAATLAAAGRAHMVDRFGLDRHLIEIEQLYRGCLAPDPSRPAEALKANPARFQ